MKKVIFFYLFCAGSQEWELEQFDKAARACPALRGKCPEAYLIRRKGTFSSKKCYKVKMLEQEKLNFPSLRFAGDLVTQARWKRLNQRFLNQKKI